MLRIASLLLVLSPQDAARTKPEPPPVGSGVHVTSTLKSSLALRFTADGKELRKFDRAVEEQTKATIDVVKSLEEGLDAKKGELDGLETPLAPPPYVRVIFDKECPVRLTGSAASESAGGFADESGHYYFIERAAPKEEDRRRVHSMYFGTVNDDIQARVRADADGFVFGPRFAPLVLGRELKPGETLDVAPEIVAPLASQAVTDGTVTKAQLTFKGEAKDGATELLDFGIAVVVEWKGSDELPVSATFELAGELKLVKRTAQPFALELAGPIRCGGTSDENGAKLEIAGTGSLSFTYRAEPLAAK